jgi:hypothetical protein
LAIFLSLKEGLENPPLTLVKESRHTFAISLCQLPPLCYNNNKGKPATFCLTRPLFLAKTGYLVLALEGLGYHNTYEGKPVA